MYEHIIPALLDLFANNGWIYLLLGSSVGLLFGILPGLGGPQVLALLIPMSITLDPSNAIILLISAMGAIATGGSLPAILINTPGTGESAATALDGFELAKQGKAGYAIGAAVGASMFGAIFGAVILTIILPFSKVIVLAFSYQEYFMMAVMGLSLIAVLSQGSLWKGIVSGCIGLLIATIGMDPISGQPRYTFDIYYLWDGIHMVPLIIGLFAVSEAVELFAKKGPIADSAVEGKLSGVRAGFFSPFKYFKTWLRSSIIGTIIGIIPGVGGAVANWVAYGQEVTANGKNGKFGKGDIRGVIAPESANNAKDGGSLVPTLIFGVPGSAQMAVLIGALIIHGLTPGPKMVQNNPGLILLLIYTLVAANIVVAILSLLVAKHMAKLTYITGEIMGPLVFVIALLGAYVSNSYVEDVIIALIFGFIGYTMKRFGYSRVALLIAFVLGTLIQQSMWQSLIVGGWTSFFTRPVSLVLLILTIILVAYPYLKKNPKSGGGASHGA